MAYTGGDGYLAAWAANTLEGDKLAESLIHLLGVTGDQGEPESLSAGASRGFIIRDWFGPFLLGPSSRFLRGRC